MGARWIFFIRLNRKFVRVVQVYLSLGIVKYFTIIDIGGEINVYCEWTTLVVPSCSWFRSVVSFTRQVELQSTEALMPQMTDERVRVGCAVYLNPQGFSEEACRS